MGRGWKGVGVGTGVMGTGVEGWETWGGGGRTEKRGDRVRGEGEGCGGGGQGGRMEEHGNMGWGSTEDVITGREQGAFGGRGGLRGGKRRRGYHKCWARSAGREGGKSSEEVPE